MGCGCRGRKPKKTNNTKNLISSVNQQKILDIKNKQSICDKCTFSTPITKKIVNRKKTRVSVRKKCTLINKPISEIVTNPSIKCPKNYF